MGLNTILFFPLDLRTLGMNWTIIHCCLLIKFSISGLQINQFSIRVWFLIWKFMGQKKLIPNPVCKNVWMEYYEFKVFTSVLWWFTTTFAYSGMPCFNRGVTPESRWIHLRVGIHCVLFLVGKYTEVLDLKQFPTLFLCLTVIWTSIFGNAFFLMLFYVFNNQYQVFCSCDLHSNKP